MQIGNIYKRAISELKKAGIETPELDARVLLSCALEKDSVFLFAHSDSLLTNSEYLKFRRFIRRRKKLEPVAYILGFKEFYGYNFQVNKNVLIPRPETEFLVEKTLEIIKKDYQNNRKISIIDIGTGSGCIIQSLALELEKHNDMDKFKFYATDNSNKALNVAKKNAKLHGLNKKIRFFRSDLFSNKRLPKSYDIIIANLPYVSIKTKSKKPKPTDFEPQEAIFTEKNGTLVINRLIMEISKKILFKYLLLETDNENIGLINNELKKVYQKTETFHPQFVLVRTD